jgi:hypothetical protein
MTRLIKASVLLVLLTTPALAAKWSAVPKATQKDITKWEGLHGKRTLWNPESLPAGELDKILACRLCWKRS